MNLTETLNVQGVLAMAAYADATMPFADALKAIGMTNTQANAFVASWSLVDQAKTGVRSCNNTSFHGITKGLITFDFDSKPRPCRPRMQPAKMPQHLVQQGINLESASRPKRIARRFRRLQEAANAPNERACAQQAISFGRVC